MAHFNRSAAVDLASTQWEKVAKRAHNVMQEDGTIVRVDPTHLVVLNVEIQQAAPIPNDQSSSAAAHPTQLSSIIADTKYEATSVIYPLDFSCFTLPPVAIKNDQQKIDLAIFDAMIEELNGQEHPITKSQLIDAMLISLNLRKHIAHLTSSIATRTGEDDQATDLVHYDAMIAELNEQEPPISKAQLIEVLCACSKLRKYVETAIESATRMSQCDDQGTASVDKSLIQVTVNNNLDTTRLYSSEQQPTSSIAPSAHRSDPIVVNKLDYSLSSCSDQPQVELPISNKMDETLESKFDDHVTVDHLTTGNNVETSDLGCNIQPSMPFDATDLGHHKGSASIGGTTTKRYQSDTISNAAKRREKAPVTAGKRSGFDKATINKPINRTSSTPIPSRKGPSIDPDGTAKDEPAKHSADTISSTAKRCTKVPPAARPGFDDIAKTKRNPPSNTPIPFMHHDRKKGPSIDGTKGKPMYSADTISNAAKRRTKVPPTARSGFDNITKKNPTIPDVLSALPGIKNPLYNHVPSRHEQNALERMAKSLVVIAQQSRVCFLFTTACDTIQEFEVFTTCMCPELMDRPAWRLRKSYIACLKAECLTLDVGHIQWQSRLVEAHTLVTSVLSDQSAKKMHPYATFIQLAVEFFTKSNKASEIDSKDDEKLNETFMGELLDIIFKITSFAANATATKSLKELLMEWNPPSWFSDQWPAAQQDATFFDSISWMMAMCACSSKYVEDLLIYKRLFLRLGLSPDATWNDVVRAFRRQTLALHEDKNTPEMSEEEIADRKRRYLLIDEAKNKLRDKLVGVDE